MRLAVRRCRSHAARHRRTITAAITPPSMYVEVFAVRPRPLTAAAPARSTPS